MTGCNGKLYNGAVDDMNTASCSVKVSTLAAVCLQSWGLKRPEVGRWPSRSGVRSEGNDSLFASFECSMLVLKLQHTTHEVEGNRWAANQRNYFLKLSIKIIFSCAIITAGVFHRKLPDAEGLKR